MLLASALLTFALPASAKPLVRRALVIAHNGSGDAELAPLHFADDDGVLWAETLQRLGVETTLLVDPDEPTRQLGRPVLASALPPTREEVTHAVARLREAHRADRAAGREPEVLVIYVGHGNTDAAGRAYFALADGRLDRTAFYAQIVDALEADYVHVIVDACHASGVVAPRGASDAEVLAELRGVLARERLSARPHVGILFAESEDGETHEWSRIRAGIFSHVTRSGLMGAADINGDGVVEYSELGAFIAASLQGVKGLPSRLTVHVFAPARSPRRPLVGPAPAGPVLHLPAGFEHVRLSVEDAQGLRLADLRLTEGQPLTLHLPVRSVYWVRAPDAETQVRLEQLGVEELKLEPREVQERGPSEEALQHGLFTLPLDRVFYEQYVDAMGLVPVGFSEAPVPDRALPLTQQQGWELGLIAGQAPVAGGLAAGPTVAWRSLTTLSFYYGFRAGYALTPFKYEGARVHRASLQGLWGLRSHGPRALFAEAALGYALVGITYPGNLQGDASVVASHVAAGIVTPTPLGGLRIAGLLGTDRLSVDGLELWDLSYGLELALRP